MLLLLLIVLLILALGGGFWGSGNYGPYSWSPLGIILVVVVILALTGNLNL